MKIKELLPILKGISNAYPDIDVVFDVHNPEPLADACLAGDEVFDAMDVRDINVYLDSDEPLAIVSLISPIDSKDMKGSV